MAARCCAALGQAAGGAGMVGGQVDDMAAEFQTGDLAQLESIHRRKTGAMIRRRIASGRIGGRRADPRTTLGPGPYGVKLGLAFQIMDDVLDLRGDEVAMGKRLGKDTTRGKLTFPSLLGGKKVSNVLVSWRAKHSSN